MFPCAGFGNGFWWIFPVIMIVMTALCFFMMRGRMGSMMCRPGFRGPGGHEESASDSASGVIDKQYARGETDKGGYEEKKGGPPHHN